MLHRLRLGLIFCTTTAIFVYLNVFPMAQKSLAYSIGRGITDVAGVKVGHFTLKERPTGCTAILLEAGAVGGVDVRGFAPGTRETDLLDPVNTVQKYTAFL